MRAALGVWWDETHVGQLMIDEHGEMEFAYDPAWRDSAQSRPISRSLPLQADAFDRRRTRPFFAGLLPEADIRKSVARVLGVSEQNDFGLLKRLGGDVAGALTLWPNDELPPKPGTEKAQKPLDDEALIELLDILPRRPLLAGEGEARLSLAGAQTKLPVVLVKGRIALPASGQPTTHILKPAIRDLEHSTENEAFAMQLAAAVGLVVAPATPMTIKDRSFLLVTRYDRDTDELGHAHRLHQEDFCQALGISPERKYSAEGGPTFKTSFGLLRDAATQPAVELLKLLDAAIFNLIVGNADAHGKNFSLLYNKDETVLAPLYDLMCTVAYPKVSNVLAMKFAKASDLKDFNPKIWDRFAQDIEMSTTYIRRRIQELSTSMRDRAGPVATGISEKGFDPNALNTFAEIVRERSGIVAETAATRN